MDLFFLNYLSWFRALNGLSVWLLVNLKFLDFIFFCGDYMKDIFLVFKFQFSSFISWEKFRIKYNRSFWLLKVCGWVEWYEVRTFVALKLGDQMELRQNFRIEAQN